MRAFVPCAILILVVIEIFSVLPHRAALPPKMPHPSKELSGIIHVHSVYSDGGGTFEDIARAARRAGHDFVVLTDHNNIEARARGQGNYEGVDLFVEIESSLPAGHLLGFLSHTPAAKLDSGQSINYSWQHFVGDDDEFPQAFVVAAHPSNIKNPWNRFDRFTEGIEIINFDSSWQRQMAESLSDFSLTVAIAPLNPYLAALRFFQLHTRDFVAWDNMNVLSRSHFGILAHDSHEKLKLNNTFIFRWPTYLATFKLASNIVMLESEPPANFESRKKAIYEAIRGGRIAIVFHSIHPYAGNLWQLNCPDGTSRSGALVREQERCTFIAQIPEGLPYPAFVRILRDGKLWKEAAFTSPRVEFPLKLTRGTYRAEIWVKPRTVLRLLLNRDVPYVLYNPIYVR